MKKTDELCCAGMQIQLAFSCRQHDDPYDCPDALVVKHKRTYGLIVHDGNQSFIQIFYCPWCGARL